MAEVGGLRPGEIFAGYYGIERLLKSGGMGAVYVVRHVRTGKRQALKVMRPEIVADAGARARFEQEALVASVIDAPRHIVDVAHAGIDEPTGMPFIVMELLVGDELGELLQSRGRLPASEVLEYLRQTARALDRAHAKGVVHRDLKPENLFLVVREDEPPTIKILDFGIAKILQGASQSMTNAGGTPLYMAPEQTAKGNAISPATDVWALGLITYALLVGRPYWEAEGIGSLFREVLIDPYEPPSARAQRQGVTLPAAFDAWMLRCLAREPAGRFQRAGEAIDALSRALGVELATRPSTPRVLPTLAMDATAPMSRAPQQRTEPLVGGATTGSPVVALDARLARSSPSRKSPLFVAVGAAVAVTAVGGWLFLGRGGDAPSGASAAPGDPPTPTQPPTTEKHVADAAPSKQAWLTEVGALGPFVRVGGSAIHAHEVTRAEYARYLAALPGEQRDAMRPLDGFAAIGNATSRLPVTWVTWEQADAYCRAIGGALPTSDEWGAALGAKYPWGAQWPKDLSGVAIAQSADAQASEVSTAALDVTPAGVHDLAGNVEEWTSTVTDGLATVRGGSAAMDAIEAQKAIVAGLQKFTATAAGTGAKRESIAGAFVGFRCVRR